MLGVEPVPLAEAVGRVLAEGILADIDMPPFDRSQMDGFAVRAEDTAGAPVELAVAGESAAGSGWFDELLPGTAVRIMTGAPVPPGADAVQKVELTAESDGVVRIIERVEMGRNIVACGAEVAAGTPIFEKGERITDAMIAPLAAFGKANVLAGRRPRVSVLSTGSEIVPVDELPGRDQIRNSNGPALRALTLKFGGVPTVHPAVGDGMDELISAIANAARDSDILVITGGVSVGKYDLTKDALGRLGGEIFFEKVRLKPGKPAVFAKLGGCLVFGLPGNPVSAAVTFYLFVRPAILAMQGAADTRLRSATAVLASAVKAPAERDALVPARLATDGHARLIAVPLVSQGSSDLVSFAEAEALVSVPQGNVREENDVVPIFML